MNSAVWHSLSVDFRFRVKILLKLLVYEVGHRLPAETHDNLSQSWEGEFVRRRTDDTYHSSLFTASPKPGVSTTESLSCTPPSLSKTGVESI